MKDHRLWMFGFLLILTSALSGDAQTPGHIPYPGEPTDGKRVNRAARVLADKNRVAKLPPPVDEKQLERAESTIAQYYDKVGKRLTATLADDEIPIPQRVQAAKRLGIMKYPPAIKILIQNIQLVEPDIVISGNETEPLVARIALAQYGDAAVPQVVEAYLDEPVRWRGHLFLYAILGGKTGKVATTYLAGLRTQKDERVTAAKLKEWHDYIGIEIK